MPNTGLSWTDGRRDGWALLEADITVPTWLDADRLDLGRVGKALGGEAVHGGGADPVLRELAYQRSLRG